MRLTEINDIKDCRKFKNKTAKGFCFRSNGDAMETGSIIIRYLLHFFPSSNPNYNTGIDANGNLTVSISDDYIKPLYLVFYDRSDFKNSLAETVRLAEIEERKQFIDAILEDLDNNPE